MRLECLQVASRYGHVDSTPEQVVARAQSLYDFVRGQDGKIGERAKADDDTG